VSEFRELTVDEDIARLAFVERITLDAARDRLFIDGVRASYEIIDEPMKSGETRSFAVKTDLTPMSHWPVNVDYTLPNWATWDVTGRPLKNGMPTFTTVRGGIRFLSTPRPMTRREIIASRKKAVRDRRTARLMRPWRWVERKLTHNVDTCVHCRRWGPTDYWSDWENE
jgi:hypothetical protein